MKNVLHFAHGNGFPSPCYRQLLRRLETRFNCYYIDKIGHDPAFPVTENWDYLVDEMIASIRLQTSEPIIGVGHSLGGVLTLLAAILQPTLFKQVILLDSPLLGRIKSLFVQLAKSIGLIDRITPAYRTLGRRQSWDSREKVLTYLKSKVFFQTFTEDCLNDYIDFGMLKEENKFSLRFDPQIEYQIFRTIPHILKKYEGKLKVPTTLIYGDKSDVIDRLNLQYMKKYYDIQTVKIQGTHMFPLEHPQETANLILSLVP